MSFFLDLSLDLSGEVDVVLDLDVAADVFVVFEVVEESLELLVDVLLLEARERCPIFPQMSHFSCVLLLRSGHSGLKCPDSPQM